MLCAANIIRRGDAFHRQLRSRAGEPWQQGETQTQQPVTPYRNGDSTYRQTDRLGQTLQAPGTLLSHWWRDPDFTLGLQRQLVVGSQLSSRLHLLRPSSSACTGSAESLSQHCILG